MTAAVSVSSLTVDLAGRRILEIASLSIAAGEVTALVGRNGAGKTTFLRAVAGLAPSRGEILIGGRPLPALSRLERARAIAYLAQAGRVFWPLPAREIVALGRTPHGASWRARSAVDVEAVDEALERLDLARLADEPATRLSGGELARVLLARALAVRAPILLADEPVAALDPAHQLRAMETLKQEAARGRAVVVVMHDVSLAMRFADRFALFDQGRVAADGPPRALIEDGALDRAFGLRFVCGEVQGEAFAAAIARPAPGGGQSMVGSTLSGGR